MTNEEYFEKRFEYLRQKSIEELKKMREELIEEIAKYEIIKKGENKEPINPEQKSEIVNSDLPYDNDVLRYIEQLLEEREQKKL